MQTLENQSLKSFNTLGFAANTRYLVAARSNQEITQALEFAETNNLPLLILGGGSNLVLAADHPGITVKVEVTGREVTNRDATSLLLRCGAGENWHALVTWTLAQGYYGLENLSLIPGNVGAAPIQNIGAYGVELEQVFHSLEAIEVATGEAHVFTRDECEFGYRESIFKNRLRDKFVITHVTLSLSLLPTVNLSYPSLAQALSSVTPDRLTPQIVSDTVCKIRSSKLPDPMELGNVGSFFKNPVLDAKEYAELQALYPNIVGFPSGNEQVKVAAAWLIETCGWKGYRESGVGIYPHQALVLVNYGEGTCEAFLDLALRVKKSVLETFNIALELEPRIYPPPENYAVGKMLA